MSTPVKKAPAKAKARKRKPKPSEPRRGLSPAGIEQLMRAEEAMRISSNLDREQVPHRFR